MGGVPGLVGVLGPDIFKILSNLLKLCDSVTLTHKTSHDEEEACDLNTHTEQGSECVSCQGKTTTLSFHLEDTGGCGQRSHPGCDSFPGALGHSLYRKPLWKLLVSV